MVDWNVGYNTGDYWVRIGGGGGGTVPYYPPGTYPGTGVLVPNQNNQMIWLLLIVAGAVLLLKD